MGKLIGYFGIGASAGGLRSWAGNAISNVAKYGGFIVGSLSGSAWGAVDDFIGAAGNAWRSGVNFDAGLATGANGLITGGLTGGLAGNLVRGISDSQNGYSFWNGTSVDEYEVAPIGKEVSDNIQYTMKMYI